jgi:hypothetical protein
MYECTNIKDYSKINYNIIQNFYMFETYIFSTNGKQ